jgi:hypothetical protein
MTRFQIILSSAVGVLALSEAVAHAAPEPQTLTASDFNGVWAPEMRRPGGPGGPGGGPGFGPRGPQTQNADGSTTVRFGPPGGPGGPGGRGFGPPLGGGFGPPPGGPGFGPPGGPGGAIEISAEDEAKGLDQGDIRTRSQMTEAGKAKFATFDPVETPEANCKTQGLPTLAMIPELQQWSVTGNQLTIRHESHATLRNVRLDQTFHPTDTHSVLGHAYGKFDGTTLVIETGNLNAEWGGLGRNAPGSDQRTVRETYRLVDKDTIEGFIEINDPLYLTHSLRMPVRLHRQPAGTEIVDFPCDVEVAKRDYQYIKDGAKKQ